MNRIMPVISVPNQPKIRPQIYRPKDLGIHKANTSPSVPDAGDDPNITPTESDGDAWCRKMREMDEHIEDIRTGE